jgi:hypothetical protein
VQRAWRVSPPAETVSAYDSFLQDSKGCEPTELREEYDKAVRRLMKGEKLPELDRGANELMLIHGTKPETVANILEKSLDPGLAHNGIFGRGTYFAEHAAKIDQYVHVDKEWVGGNREQRYGAKCRLHNKLYPTSDLHPGNVHYALVCRVKFGTPYRTRKRRGQKDGHHSTLAELGKDASDAIKRFREFVVFDKAAIKIEYLVCYTRVRRYCRCGDIVREACVQAPELKDRGTDRPTIGCPNAYPGEGGRWTGGCGLFAVLPRCYCRRSDKRDFWPADVGPKGKPEYYCCKKGRCGFGRQPIEQGVDLREAEDEDEDKFDMNDGFMVPDASGEESGEDGSYESSGEEEDGSEEDGSDESSGEEDDSGG